MVKKMTREYEERISELFENTRKLNEIRFSQHMKERRRGVFHRRHTFSPR